MRCDDCAQDVSRLYQARRGKMLCKGCLKEYISETRRHLEYLEGYFTSQDVKTLKAVIKDLEMIMREATDLKSLEKMIADYISEKRGKMPEEGK